MFQTICVCRSAVHLQVAIGDTIALDRAVKTCLAKDPDKRWQTVHDLGWVPVRRQSRRAEIHHQWISELHNSSTYSDYRCAELAGAPEAA